MIRKTTGSARDFLPESRDYKSLRDAAARCKGCALYRDATQTVFGEGPAGARLMLVGEQPGDQEDRTGHPFVGPAGRVLDEALAEAGIDRGEVYLTNAVKHFKFTRQGQRRLHKKPGAREMAACHPWIEAELRLVDPKVLVCLGATAAQALIGRDFRITRQRGEWVTAPLCERTIATYHPSAILRARDEASRTSMRQALFDDLKLAWKAAGD